MNTRDAVRRLEAFAQGRPVPRGRRIAHRICDAKDVLILAFVRMGGESRPWGVAVGHPDARPELLTVPEARDRDLVATMMARFTPRLLRHLRSPAVTRPRPTDHLSLAPLRQVWLPNGSHLDMIHHIAYAYTFTRAGGDLQAELNALGRTCNWLFRDAHRPGQQHVVVATQVLSELFTFPFEDARQGHLGYLLAWLEARGDWHARLAAASEVERASTSTTLDPAVERERLEPLVDALRSKRAARRPVTSEERAIDGILREELERRYDLVADAWRLLRADHRRENTAVADLVEDALKAQWYDWARVEAAFADGERPFVPSVETDRDGRAAAALYAEYAAADEALTARLVHDDPELLGDAVARGDAIVGRIEDVADEGIGKTTLPVWRISEAASGPLRLREGSKVAVVGLPRRTGDIRRITTSPDGGRVFEIVITNLKTAPKGASRMNAIPPADPRWRGHDVVLVAAATDLSFVTRKKLWQPDLPGAWLTLSSPPDISRHGDDAEGAVAS